MTEKEQNSLISIIQNMQLSTDQKVNKLYAELEKLSNNTLLSKPISIFESIENEELIFNSRNNLFKQINLNDPSLESKLGFLNKRELVIFAGRPAMGKTQFLIHLANSIAENHSVMYYSLDLNISDLSLRFLANESGISYNQNKERSSIFKVKNNFKNKKIHLVDSPVNSLFQFKQYLKNQIIKLNIEVVFIDYLQLLSDKNYRIREQEISSIMKNLKSLAKELNVCFILASQLSRSVELRGGDKRPILSDLRESGSIEEYSDKVIFIYRPEYYQLTMDEHGESTLNKGELIVAKNNTGMTQIINIERDAEFTRFYVKENLSWDFKVEGL